MIGFPPTLPLFSGWGGTSGPPADPAAIERLFDEGRNPSELVRDDDWHPGPPEFRDLDASDRLETRRRWYANLRAKGQV